MTDHVPKILVVDDEQRNRTLLGDILSTKGYETYEAADGNEALARVQEILPDVILLDLRMPGMDGMEVIRRLKADERFTHTPIVIVTGQDDQQSRVEALRLGADDFLTKPPHLEELTARVRSLVTVKAYYDSLLTNQERMQAEVDKRTVQLQIAVKKLQEIYGQLKRASLDSIYRLSLAAEYKDEDTSSHIQRISHYARLVARKLGLDEEAQESVLYASPMHDIGKIGIPDRILLKAGSLTPEEWTIMRQHTLFGGQILAGGTDGFIKMAHTIALTHHEKWDGSGYPSGLTGQEIPLEGRITAVVDVFDALCSRRPYKKAFPVDEALTAIAKGKGSHFDPEIVHAFFGAKDELLAVKKRFEDGEVSPLYRLALARESATEASLEAQRL